jgi:hypothetical protein
VRLLSALAAQDLKYNDVAKPDPESQPYPWVGRSDKDLLKWQERARTFQRRQREKELKIANRKLKESCVRIQKKEAALVRAEVLRRCVCVCVCVCVCKLYMSDVYMHACMHVCMHVRA